MSTFLSYKCGSCGSDPCAGRKGDVAIDYDWSGTGMKDLDTKTEFVGCVVGWSCGSGCEYLQWTTSDDTSVDGTEHVDANVFPAKAAGLWTSSVQITLYAGWYSPSEGSGGAKVRVTFKGVTKEKDISPGSQSGCCSTQVGVVTFYDDETFTLE